MFEINGLFESRVIAIDQHRVGLDGTLASNRSQR
jgi:hypothetical protein